MENNISRQQNNVEKKYDVFISYRRSSTETARNLEQALVLRGLKVFFDMEELDDGKFNEKLYDAIDQSRNAIFLMTKGALDSCTREGDWVRNELERILKQGINLILVHPSGVELTFPDGLPPSLSGIRYIEATELHLGKMFSDSVTRIVKRLKGVKVGGRKDDGDIPALGKPKDEVALSGLKGQDAQHFKKALGYYNVVRYRSALAELDKIVVQENPFVKYYVLLIRYILEGDVEDLDFEAACCAARDLGCTDAMRLFADRHMPNDKKPFDPVSPSECIEWLKKAVAGGSAAALADLGTAYEDGKVVVKDLAKARKLYRMSYEAGSFAGKSAYGQDCLLGKAGEVDLVMAREVLRPVVAYLRMNENELSSAEYGTLLMWYSPLNNGIVKMDQSLVEKYANLIIDNKGKGIADDLTERGCAHLMLGIMCLSPRGEDDLERAKAAFEHFKSAHALMGCTNGMTEFWLAHCYENGIGVDVDDGKALEYYESADEMGNANAQWVLASRIFNSGDEQNIERGKMLLKSAAEGGDSEAEHIYGLYLIRGVYFDRDVNEGLKWLEKAAVHDNDADAMNSLGEQYRDGIDGVERDCEKAFKWFEKGAVGGSTDAMQSLGWAYLIGQGTARDVGAAEKWFVKAAKKGGADEKNTLGTRYYNGDFGSPDMKSAFEWIRMAAKDGSVFAMNNIGEMYRDGDGVEKDIDEAIKWFLSAAKKKYSDAIVNLGWIYLNGDGVDKDAKKAEEWFVQAAKTHDIDAEITLGCLYYNGEFGEKSFDKAKKWWELAADQGNEVAMNYLGEMYRDGEGSSKNIGLAIKWLKDAAGKGNLTAMTNLGWLYLKDDANKDLAEAEKWFVKAAETRDADAECGLGTRYAQGAFGIVDYVKAKEWWEKAAEQNYLIAMWNLGDMYQRGEDGVPQDRRLAFVWFKRASEAGLPEAMERLGLAYLSGVGTVVDEEKAKEWLVKAAENGNASAECSLGTRYAEGEFGEKDFKEAVVWWRKAAENGDTTAMCNLGCIFSDPDLSDNVIQIDLDEARKWFHNANDAGSEYAAYCIGLDVSGALGNRYETYAGWQVAFAAANPEMGSARRILRKAGSWFAKPLDAHTDDAILAGACLRWLARIARYQENIEEAKDLYRKAAENGDEKARVELAEIDVGDHTAVGMASAEKEVPPSSPVTQQTDAASATSVPKFHEVSSIPAAQPVSAPIGDEASRAEALFLRKSRRFKKNDGRIDKDEKSELRELAEELGISSIRREELIEQVEEEFESAT